LYAPYEFWLARISGLIRKAVGCSCLKLGTPKVENRTQFHNFWMANIVNLYCIVGATEAPAFNREKYRIRWYWVGGR
jgi:hypothetical protein